MFFEVRFGSDVHDNLEKGENWDRESLRQVEHNRHSVKHEKKRECILSMNISGFEILCWSPLGFILRTFSFENSQE